MSLFSNSLEFLHALGFFDVIMPFILIFVLLYAVLQRTNILGYFIKEKDKLTPVRKKNLDAMAAFSIAFIVIGSSKAVAFITAFVAKTMIIFVIVSLLIILTASLYGYSGKDFEIEKTYRKWLLLAILVSIGVILFMMIDFNAILNNPNVMVMRNVFSNMSFMMAGVNWNDVFYSLLVLAIFFGMMWLIVKEDTPKDSK